MPNWKKQKRAKLDQAQGLNDFDSGFGETTTEQEARLEASATSGVKSIPATALKPSAAEKGKKPIPSKNQKQVVVQPSPAVPIVGSVSSETNVGEEQGPKPGTSGVADGPGEVPDSWEDGLDEDPVTVPKASNGASDPRSAFVKDIPKDRPIINVGAAGLLKTFGNKEQVHHLNPIVTSADAVREAFNPLAEQLARAETKVKRHSCCPHTLRECTCEQLYDAKDYVFNHSAYFMRDEDLQRLPVGCRMYILVDVDIDDNRQEVTRVCDQGREYEHLNPVWLLKPKAIGCGLTYVPDVRRVVGKSYYIRATIVKTAPLATSTVKVDVKANPQAPTPQAGNQSEVSCLGAIFGFVKRWWSKSSAGQPSKTPEEAFLDAVDKAKPVDKPDGMDDEEWTLLYNTATRLMNVEDLTDDKKVRVRVQTVASSLLRRFDKSGLDLDTASTVAMNALCEVRGAQVRAVEKARLDHTSRFALGYEEFKSPLVDRCIGTAGWATIIDLIMGATAMSMAVVIPSQFLLLYGATMLGGAVGSAVCYGVLKLYRAMKRYQYEELRARLHESGTQL